MLRVRISLFNSEIVSPSFVFCILFSLFHYLQGKKMGEMWRALSDAEKEEFKKRKG
jgi:hypothetical protein